MDAGALLRRRRLLHAVSQRELGLRAGTKQATISRIENGHEVPTVDRLAHLLVALGDRLELEVAVLDPERDPTDIAADRRASMGQRLEAGFALAAFASQLAGTARG